MSRRGATALVVLASVLLVGASLAAYGRIALFDADRFADRAAASLQDPSVRTLIGERVTDDVVLRNEADLLAARPIIESAVSGIVGGGAFGSLFRRAVVDAHRAIFDHDRNTVTLTLADVGTVVAAALEKVNPRLAADLDAEKRVVLLKREHRRRHGRPRPVRRAAPRPGLRAGGADPRRGRRARSPSRAIAGAPPRSWGSASPPPASRSSSSTRSRERSSWTA